MDKDVLGNVTFERLKRAVEFGTDVSYTSSLLDRYLVAKMKDLSLLGYIDFSELQKSLALFGIGFNSVCNEKVATLNRAIPELKWFTYIYDKNSNTPVGKKWVIVSTGGVLVETERYKKSKQRPYKDLPPDLQKKIVDIKKKRSASAKATDERTFDTSPKLLKMLEERQNKS